MHIRPNSTLPTVSGLTLLPFLFLPLTPHLQWLEIKPTDDEKTVARKKKLLKSFKSKRRFQEMDVKQKERQSNWQSFLKGKGSKPKTGGWPAGTCRCAASDYLFSLCLWAQVLVCVLSSCKRVRLRCF
jgi:hypothetical protein